MTEVQIEKIKQLYEDTRKMNDFYTKKNQEKPNDVHKAMENHYEGKEVGIGAVLDILGIDL